MVVVRDEYKAWLVEARSVIILYASPTRAHANIPLCRNMIDYYGITCNHLVPASNMDPDVLQINIVEIQRNVYANNYNPLDTDRRIRLTEVVGRIITQRWMPRNFQNRYNNHPSSILPPPVNFPRLC